MLGSITIFFKNSPQPKMQQTLSSDSFM